MEPPPPGIGFFHKLDEQVQHGFVEYAHQSVRRVRAAAREDSAEHVAYVKAKVKTASVNELQA